MAYLTYRPLHEANCHPGPTVPDSAPPGVAGNEFSSKPKILIVPNKSHDQVKESGSRNHVWKGRDKGSTLTASMCSQVPRSTIASISSYPKQGIGFSGNEHPRKWLDNQAITCTNYICLSALYHAPWWPLNEPWVWDMSLSIFTRNTWSGRGNR